MDPNFIQMDWERTFDALMLVTVLAVIVERSLSVVFQNRIYIERVDRDGLKELIALALSITVCVAWKFDALGMIILSETTTTPGYIMTGAVIAGGSKGSLKLFQDVLGLQSSAYKVRHTIEAEQAASEAETALAKAETAPNTTIAAVERAKAENAVRRVRVATAKAVAEGNPIPTGPLTHAEVSLAVSKAVVGKTDVG